jgi:hypothetical protein
MPNSKNNRTLLFALVRRHYNTTESASSQAAAATQAASSASASDMSALAQLRQMTASQLRALNQFSKYVVRAAYEQGISAAANREWVRRLQQFPAALAKDGPKEEPKMQPPVEVVVAAEPANTAAYTMPHIFSSLAHNLEKAGGDAYQPEVVPEWKLKRSSSVSKVIPF